MAAVTVCSHFGAQEKKICHCFHLSPFYLPWCDRTACHDLSFFEWVFFVVFFFFLRFKSALHSPLSLSSGGSLVPLHFLLLRVVLSAYLEIENMTNSFHLFSCDSYGFWPGGWASPSWKGSLQSVLNLSPTSHFPLGELPLYICHLWTFLIGYPMIKNFKLCPLDIWVFIN